jgi:type VI secretion system protein ImpM
MPAAPVTVLPGSDVGFYGKMPAHRDFVSRGLPRVVADQLHDWLEAAVAASSSALGDACASAWRQAACWRFTMPAGACGIWPVRGVIIPSADEAGRRFPLVLLVRYLSVGAAPAETESCTSEDGFFAALEAAARDASAGMCPAEPLRSRLEAAVAVSITSPREPESVWHSNDQTPRRLSGPGMPPPVAFTGMLTGDWSAVDPAPFKVTS